MSDIFAIGGLGMPGEAVLDIPHPALLSGISLDSVLETFEQEWGVPPRAVVLPVLLPDGVAFQVEGLIEMSAGSAQQVVDQNGSQMDFDRLVAEFSSRGLDIHLSIEPSARFMNFPALQVVDNLGATSRHVCIARPKTQQILGSLLSMALERASRSIVAQGTVAGIAFDVCNLWPIGASDGVIELCCFCRDCLRQGGDEFTAVVDSPQSFGLGLSDSGTGISFIDEIDWSMTASDYAAFAQRKGFVGEQMDSQEVLSECEMLLAYLKRRHEVTVSSLESIVNAAFPGGTDMPIVLLVENARWGWTSGLFTAVLDDPGRAPAGLREIWLDSSTGGVSHFQNVMYRTYMWRRARYFIDEYFNLAHSLQDQSARSTTGISRVSDHLARAMLAERGQRVLGTKSSRMALATLDEASEGGVGRQGFVAPSISSDLLSNFQQRLKIVPQSVLKEPQGDE